MSEVSGLSPEGQGITRREALKRGALLGGALVWATPAVQAIRMSPALAQVPSPFECSPGISYIGVNLLCTTDGMETCTFFRFEEETGFIFDDDNGHGIIRTQCPGFHPCEEADHPEDDGKVVVSGDEFSATVTVVDPNCVLQDVAVFGGNCCDTFLGINQTQIRVVCPSTNCG